MGLSIQTNRLATRVTLIFFLAIAALIVILAALFAFIVYDSQRASTTTLQRETAQRAAMTMFAVKIALDNGDDGRGAGGGVIRPISFERDQLSKLVCSLAQNRCVAA
jgi:hypothetical protein